MGWGLLALGLVFLVEGLLWALVPNLVEELLRLLREMPEPQRRTAGLIAACFGLTLIWLAFSLGI
ncbi:MAG: DUF2065 domain-containing protein [Rhodobacterales bacterium]|nr:MAG: DUF2065 domain-containing protein [Rhodobacterales bacterium]